MDSILPGELFSSEDIHHSEGGRDLDAADKISAQYTQDGTVSLNGQPALRHKTGAWTSASLVVATQVWSTLAFWGIGNNLVVYLIDVMHLGNAAAANIVSNWTGTAFMTPLLAAFLADSYWGRFWTSVTLTAIYVHGEVLMTISGAVSSLRPAECETMDLPVTSCPQASPRQKAVLFAGLYIIALGGGGVQSTLTAFGADQFDEEHDGEKQQKSSFFNWYYGATNLGFMVSVTVLLYFQGRVGYGVGYGLSAGVALMSLVTLLMGLPLYRFRNLSGDPFARVAQVFVASARKWNLHTPPIDQLYEDHRPTFQTKRIPHTPQFRFLDKAAITNWSASPAEDDSTQHWQLCTISQVEEVKCLLRVMPIFLTTLFFCTVFTQLSTLFIEQAMTMDRQMGSINIPPASVRVFEPLSVIIWVAIYDRLLVPMLRPYTGHPRGLSELQRIGIGLTLSIATMVIAALVESKRLNKAVEHSLLDDFSTPLPMSVFWLVPQYTVVGASETFVFIGLSEFFYGQAPDQLRSLGSAKALLSGSIGSYLSTALVMIVNRVTKDGNAEEGRDGWISDNLNRGHLDKFYWLLAILSAVNMILFPLCAHWYRYPKPVNTEIDGSPKDHLNCY